MKITILDYTYSLRRLKNGKYYIVRCFSKVGFSKWQKGLLVNRSGILK